MTYGVTAAGFVKKPADVIASEIDAALQGIVGSSAVDPATGELPVDSATGQLKTLLVDMFAAQWDLMQALYASWDPAQATGASLDRLLSLMNSGYRPGATVSTATVTLTGDPGTLVRIGRSIIQNISGQRFYTDVERTLAALDAWAPSTGYLLGARVTSGGNVYRATHAGTSSTVAPSGTAVFTDGTVSWLYLGAGTAAADATTYADVSGPEFAPAGTLTQIGTPVTGWLGVYNVADAVPGSDGSPDSKARLTIGQLGPFFAAAVPKAIRSRILNVNIGSTDLAHRQPSDVRVFFNNSDVTENGMPPHSVEVLVDGGTDQDIANEIFNVVAAGIATTGNQSSTVVDALGQTQTVKWSRPVSVAVYVATTVYYDPKAWPLAPESEIAERALSAILTRGDDYLPGDSVFAPVLEAAIIRGPQAIDASGTAIAPAPGGSPAMGGIIDAVVLVGVAPDPTDTSLIISPREQAQITSANVFVTVVSGAP